MNKKNLHSILIMFVGITIFISLVGSCCKDNHLERILPLLEVSVISELDSTTQKDSLTIKLQVVNMPDFENQDVGCDYYVQGRAGESYLGLKTYFKFSESEDWQVLMIDLDTTYLDCQPIYVQPLSYGQSVTINQKLQFQQPGFYKFEFIPDYYNSVFERDELQ